MYNNFGGNMEGKTVVEIKKLSKCIRGNMILDNIDLNFKEGNIYGITGRNGSGKSMLFKAISGLIKPTNGIINVFDKKIHEGDLPEKTGLIIENPAFLPQYTGFFNLKILASINNVITDDEIKDVMFKVGLSPNNNITVKKYSLGMRQRLGIAQAIMESPKLLILDEPMNGLDEDGVKLVRELILEMKKKSVTVLLASHNKEDIDTLCDKVYKMTDGKISALD